jgi:hypothetical protein
VATDLDKESTADGPMHDNTILLPDPKISEQLQHTIWRFGLVAAMVTIGFMFDLSLTELPFTPSDRSVSAYSIELSSPAPARNPSEDKIEAAKAASIFGKRDCRYLLRGATGSCGPFDA